MYISQLKPDFDVIELLRELRLGGHPDEVITDYAIHNNNAIFLAFVDFRFVEKVIQQCNGKMFLGSVVQASRLTEESAKALSHWKPNFAKKTLPLDPGPASAHPLANPLDMGAAQSQTKPLSGLSDFIEAFDNLTVEQQLQLKATLQLKPVASSLGVPPKTSSPYYPAHSMKAGAQPLDYSPRPCQHGAVPEQSFQFGNPNISSIRVSTFSGGSKDCSFEQFKYDVQSLFKQGCSEALVLTAIRRSIKDRAQEILLHMGEDVTVADLLSWYEMMSCPIGSILCRRTGHE